MMTKREYLALTATLKFAGDVPNKNTVRWRDWAVTVRALGHALDRANNKFNRDQFLTDCGLVP